ncbi:MAG: hypothetical protein AAFX06_18905 [Planctomycetota bacterium]
MTSSNRPPGESDAAVYRDDRPIGPLRLPRKAKKDFIAEFNRIYQGMGLVIATCGEAKDGPSCTILRSDSERRSNEERTT